MTDDDAPLFPCAGCGFAVFTAAVGSRAVCPLCGWRDDLAQLEDPFDADGANPLNLVEHQRTALLQFPSEVERQGVYVRDPEWRPATPADARTRPNAGEVCALTEDDAPRSPYYWR